MHHILFVLALIVIAAPAHALQVAHLWYNQAGDASSQFGYDVAIDDATGMVAMTGYFGGSVDFGGTTMTSVGGNDGFIVVYAPDGTFIAQRQFGSTGNQVGIALDWSSDSKLYVTGHFAGSVYFGGSTLTSVGLNDIFLARFDYLLTHQQSSRYGDAGEQFASDLAVDNSSNVVITGYFQGGVNFGGGLLTSFGANDIYVAKFGTFLTHTWSNRFGDAAGSQYGQGVDIDAAGNVYACGYFTSMVSFGGTTLTSAGGNDIYVVKLNSLGIHQWSKRFGDAGNQIGSKISAGSSGEVYVVGYFGGVVNFGGGDLTSGGLDDIFLVKFSPTGSFQWASRFGDAGSQFGLGVDNDDTHVYMSGQSSGNINFGAGGSHVGAGGRDIYIAKFTAAGSHVWSRIYGDSADQFGFGVELGAGRVALAGYFQGAMTVAPGTTPITSAGGSDTILMVTSANALEPVIKSVTDVGNDQGKKVRVRFERSGIDDLAATDPVIAYEAWVEEPFGDGPGASSGAGASPQGGGGDLVYVGSIPAHTEPVYTMLVPTFVDSTIADGDYNTHLLIRAARSTPTSLFQSTPAIGSSIDNLAPGMEALRFDSGLLHWNGSDAPDVKYYAIYGGATASFGSATLIDYTIDTQIDMDAHPRAYYFVTATDFSGNEGEPEMLRVLTTTGDASPSYVLSISAYPNPFNPATTIRYTVPARDRVRIEIFDARGGLVTRLVDEERRAGAYTLAWDGTDATGRRAGSGIYFARIAQRDGTRSYKLVLLK